jgi:hypothetical protein
MFNIHGSTKGKNHVEHSPRLSVHFVIFTLVLIIRNAALRTVSVDEELKTAATGEWMERVTCSDLPSRYSICTGYVEGMNMWLSHTEDGPTGVDGGLINLFSSYRACS